MHWLLLAIVVGTQIHVFTMALIGSLFGVGIKKISIGYGPQIFAKGVLVIKLLAFGGFVTFRSKYEPDEKTITPGCSFEEHNYFVRVFISISGCILLLLASWALLGNEVFNELIFTMKSAIQGAMSPLVTGSFLVSQAVSFLDSNGGLTIFGTVFVTIAGLNLLPIPTLNGAQLYLELIPVLEVREKLMVFGIICILAFFISWLLALGNFVIG